MSIEIEKIAHELRKRGEDWADKDAAANLLEETKHSVLAQCMASYPEDSNAAAETKARRDPIYLEHIRMMVEARREATRARVRLDSLKAYIELYRTSESSRRAEMQIR